MGNRLDAYSRWLRLLVAQALNDITRDAEGAQGAVQRLSTPTLLLPPDEFAALGRLEAVERAMGLMAGYGMQLWPILQDMSQLKDLYGARANTFVANAGVLQTFGVNDFETAKWLSQSMGKETIGYQTESYARHIEQELDKTIGRILDRLDVQHSNFEADRRDTAYRLDDLVQQEENGLQRLRADQEKALRWKTGISFIALFGLVLALGLAIALSRVLADSGFGCDVIGGAWTRSTSEAEVCVFYSG